MDSTAEQFANYACGLRYSDLTPGAIHAVKRSLVDSIGCAIGSFHSDAMKAIRNLAAQVSATKPATIFGTQIRSSPELAAFVNGSMIRYADFSDDYFGGNGDTGPHPSDNIGGILAAAEAAGADGRSLVTGVALAYEVCGQLVDHTALGVRGWDYPVFHSIATALGSGRILELTREQMGNALGLAIVPNICLNQSRFGEISVWKGLRGPNGSRNGLFATLLAQQGITGPRDPFEGKAGFMTQLDSRFELKSLGGKGTAFKIEATFFKSLPIRYTVQLPVEVALGLRNEIAVQDIESIVVFVAKRSVITRSMNPEYWDPKSFETANYSAPYLIAAALLEGRIDSKTFTATSYRDPEVLALTKRIRVEEDKDYTTAFPRAFHCRFEVYLRSGQKITSSQCNPRGHPANPMSDDEIEQKFLGQVRDVLPEKQSRSLLHALWNVENITGMGGLFPLMLVPR